MAEPDPLPVDISWLAGRLAAAAAPGKVLVVGLTGSVAVGKTTLSDALKAALGRDYRVETHSTDGFILANARLAELDLSLRKGFPQSYDSGRLTRAIENARSGPTVLPGYSHMAYDADPALDRTIDRPDILLLEGLGFAPPSPARAALDLLIYLDADEASLERWFLARFMRFWRAAETDPASFYAQFRSMAEPEAEAFALAVWNGINLPNLREHILQARDTADLVISKDDAHRLHLVRAL